MSYWRLLEIISCEEWCAIAKSFILMIVFFCLRSLINKSVSSLDTHAVPAPGPNKLIENIWKCFKGRFFAMIFEVSALALKRSNADIILEYWLLPPKFLWFSWDGSIFAVIIVSTFFCVSNIFAIFSIVEGGYKQSSSGKAIREHLASFAP